MKLLLTGGLGYLGSHAAVEFLHRGDEVVIIDNLSNSDISVKSAIEAITKRKIEFVKADLLDADAVDKVIANGAFDAVVHFAGLKAVGESVEIPLSYYEVNLCGTINLLKSMKRHGVNKIIFSSSSTVYGAPETLPITEESRLCPTSPYGETKLTIEKILRDAAAADKNFTAVALRYFNPIGADPSGLIGEKPSGTPLNLAPFVADVAAGTRPFVGVFGNDWPTPDGTGIRDYIHVCDLAAGHAAAADFAAKKKNTGFHVFNLGTGKGTSVLEMINAFKAACGHAIPIKFLPRRAGDIAASYADCKKAKRVLGWRATRSISEMCDSMWNFRNCVKDRVLGKKD